METIYSIKYQQADYASEWHIECPEYCGLGIYRIDLITGIATLATPRGLGREITDAVGNRSYTMSAIVEMIIGPLVTAGAAAPVAYSLGKPLPSHGTYLSTEWQALYGSSLSGFPEIHYAAIPGGQLLSMPISDGEAVENWIAGFSVGFYPVQGW